MLNRFVQRSGRYLLAAGILILGCSNGQNGGHVYFGRLEADIITLSVKTGGTIDSLLVSEGDIVSAGRLLAKIDDRRHQAQKRRQLAQLQEIRLSLQGADARIRQVTPQLKLARENLKKTKNLYQNGAATQKDMDELETRVDVLEAQLDGLRTSKKVTAGKQKQLQAALEITELDIADTKISSPLDGVVLNSYHHRAETAAPGQKLFDLADLTKMEATIYVALEDLGRVKTGDRAVVRIDGSQETFSGRVAWISSESEFTPKTILTKETRTTLVYAVKIKVDNPDGVLKIGMPADVEIL